MDRVGSLVYFYVSWKIILKCSFASAGRGSRGVGDPEERVGLHLYKFSDAPLGILLILSDT